MVDFFIQSINELILKILIKYQNIDSRQKEILTQISIGNNFEIIELPEPQDLEILINNNLVYQKDNKYYVFIPVYLYNKLLEISQMIIELQQKSDLKNELNLSNFYTNNFANLFTNFNSGTDDNSDNDENEDVIDNIDIEKYLYSKMIEEFQKLKSSYENIENLKDELYNSYEFDNNDNSVFDDNIYEYEKNEEDE